MGDSNGTVAVDGSERTQDIVTIPPLSTTHIDLYVFMDPRVE